MPDPMFEGVRVEGQAEIVQYIAVLLSFLPLEAMVSVLDIEEETHGLERGRTAGGGARSWVLMRETAAILLHAQRQLKALNVATGYAGPAGAKRGPRG
jgi:hypothetical protein